MEEEFEFKPLTEGLGFHKKVVNIRDEKTPALTTAAPATRASVPTQVVRPTGWTPALKSKELLDDRPMQTVLKPIVVSWPSAIFDSTMILGMTLLFSAVVFAVTGIDLADLLEMLRSDGAARAAAAVLLFSVIEIYAVACRSFFGKTLGEWTFECHLGTPAQQSSGAYPLRVALRALLVAATGFIILPIVGVIAKRDIAGALSGVFVQSEQSR